MTVYIESNPNLLAILNSTQVDSFYIVSRRLITFLNQRTVHSLFHMTEGHSARHSASLRSCLGITESYVVGLGKPRPPSLKQRRLISDPTLNLFQESFKVFLKGVPLL